MAKKQRIAYIGSFDRLYDEEGNAQGFERLGHEVLRIQEGKDLDVDQTIKDIHKFNPDFVIYAKVKIPAKRDMLLSVLKRRHKTVYWSFDLYLGYVRDNLVPRDSLFKSHYVLTPDGGHDEKWKQRRVNHQLLRQGIVDDYCYLGKPDDKYEHDVIFVGSENRHWIPRSELCHFLERTYGERFKWYGRYDTHEVRGHDLNKLYASAKIVVGDSVYSPYYWSNRVVETLGRGGFLIYPKTEGMDKEFEYYKHFIPFRSGDYTGLKEKIDYFLKHPEKRSEIASQGQQYVIKNYTITKQCQKLLKFVN